MMMEGMEELEIYIVRIQNTVAQKILDLLLESEKRLGVCVAKQWWEQVGLILVGAREGAEAGGMGEADG